MKTLSTEVIRRLHGRTLATAESCTGGGIGAALTGVPGSSSVYQGGIISYTNQVKMNLLGVPELLLEEEGAVSGSVARAMALGARKALNAQIAVSVTGLAGPTGDDRGNPVGTVYIGYSDPEVTLSRRYHFPGDREAVRRGAVESALHLILENNP